MVGGAKIVLLSFVIVLASCIKDNYDNLPKTVVWSPNLSIPLGQSSFSGSKIIDSQDSDVGNSIFEYYNSIALEDTLEFNFSEIFESQEYVKSLLFRIDAENEFPTKIISTLYFLDESYSKILNLSDTPIVLSGATVDQQGKLIKPFDKVIDIILDEEKIILLNGVKYVEVVLEVDLMGMPDYTQPYFSNYKIDIKVGVQAQLEVQI